MWGGLERCGGQLEVGGAVGGMAESTASGSIWGVSSEGDHEPLGSVWQRRVMATVGHPEGEQESEQIFFGGPLATEATPNGRASTILAAAAPSSARQMCLAHRSSSACLLPCWHPSPQPRGREPWGHPVDLIVGRWGRKPQRGGMGTRAHMVRAWAQQPAWTAWLTPARRGMQGRGGTTGGWWFEAWGP